VESTFGNWKLGVNKPGYRFVAPEQFAEIIRTVVTRTRGVAVSVVPDVPAVAEVEELRAERRVFGRGSGSITPITSTCWPTCPSNADPCRV
jgi:hypothetical protein